MTEDQFVALKAYINAVVVYKIEEAFGRERISEKLDEIEAEKLLDKLFKEAE